jgi:hypothetical protein
MTKFRPWTRPESSNFLALNYFREPISIVFENILNITCMPLKLATPLLGFLIYPNAWEITSFKFYEQVLKAFYVTRLTGGKIATAAEPKTKSVLFDFDERDQQYWPGFVRGFLYADKKFLGKAHYVSEANIPAERLEGTYRFVQTALEVKGFWFDQKNNKIGFYFILSRSGEFPKPRKKTKKKIKKKRK